jgi:hypothetical protein
MSRSGRRPHPAAGFAIIFVIAVAVRVWMLFNLVPQEYVRPHTRWEVEAVAVSLATRGTFADPYAIPTGPTAHTPPVWPVLVSLVYRAMGLTTAAGYAAWILGILVYATLFALLPWVAARLGLRARAGFLAGLGGALLAVGWPDPAAALAGLAMALILVAFLRRWTGPPSSPASAFALGLACGVALHIQPALLQVIVGCLGFEWWWRRRERPCRAVALLAGGLVLACIPWGVRNYRALHAPVFVRSNFGLEMRMAFHEGAAADIDVSVRRGGTRHPRTSVAEAVRVREMGEGAYMREARGEALAYIRTHPGETARLLAGRFLYFWLGPLHEPSTAAFVTALTVLAAVGAAGALPHMTPPQRATLLIPLATFPLIYYVVSHVAHYRIPLQWLLLLGAGAAVDGAVRRIVSGEPGRAAETAQP